MYTQRACVVRHEEPFFCPNNTYPLFTSGAVLHVSATNDNAYDCSNLDVAPHEDNAEQRLPSPHQATDLIDDFDGLLDLGASIQTLRETRPLNEASSFRRPGPPAASSNPPRLHAHHTHNHPEIREIREEVDARSEQLEPDGHTPSPVSRFDGATTPSDRLHEPNTHEPQNPSVDRPAAFTPLTAANQRTSRRHPSAALPRNSSAPSVTVDDNTAVGLPAQDGLLDVWPDGDALAVDDPRRNYDFADFMDNWRLRSIRDKRLPSFELGLQPSVRLGRTPREVTVRHVRSGDVDMQGLRWKLIGPSRDQAVYARSILNPLGMSTACQPFQRGCINKEQRYCFRSFIPKHRTKFNHYQLRNNLAASSRNEIFYAAGNHIRRASLACPDLSETVIDLSTPSNCATGFRITCLSATRQNGNSGILLAGGFYGEFAVLDLDGTHQTPAEGFVTHAYNGLVTHVQNFPDRRSGLLKAAFCSNDCNVHVMDVTTLQFTNRFVYNHALNCSATSPDGRMRVLVGDSRDVLITDAEHGHSLLTLRGHTDHGFACDWSVDGRYVAAAAQDGRTLIWDARDWSEPLCTIHSAMSCVRSLQFADNGALIVAESDDVVRVHNGGTFDICQDLRFFGSIAGVALLDGGAELIVANADNTVGGLLTFEKASHGFDGGSYGRFASAIPSEREQRRPRRSTDLSSFVCDVVV